MPAEMPEKERNQQTGAKFHPKDALGYFCPTVAAAAAQNEVAEDREKVRPGKAALAGIAAGGRVSQ